MNKELVPFRKRILPPFSVSDNPNKGFWLNPQDGSKRLLRNVSNYGVNTHTNIQTQFDMAQHPRRRQFLSTHL